MPNFALSSMFNVQQLEPFFRLADMSSKSSSAAEAEKMTQELLRMSSSDSIYGKLSNFSTGRQIGSGQFSVVYRAECKKDGRQVALKKVQIFEMTDAKARVDCMKEIQLLQVRK